MAEKKPAAETVAATEESAPADGMVVAYIGTSDWRAIYESDWLMIKIKGKDRVWSDENNHEISVSDFSAAEIAWLKADTDDFVVRPAAVPVISPVDFTPDEAQH